MSVDVLTHNVLLWSMDRHAHGNLLGQQMSHYLVTLSRTLNGSFNLLGNVLFITEYAWSYITLRQAVILH